jgi:hypothetical protein
MSHAVPFQGESFPTGGFVPVEGGRSDVHDNPDWLVRILHVEAAWLRKHNLPYGLSVLAVGRKQQYYCVGTML